MKFVEEFDNNLKIDMENAAQNIQVGEELYSNIKSEIQKKERIENDMKRHSINKKAKIALVAAIGVLIAAGATVGASTLISKDVKGYMTEKTYTKLPDKNEIAKDVGFNAKLPDTLPGGFIFDEASSAGLIDGSKANPYDDSKKEIGAIYRMKNTDDKQKFLSVTSSNAQLPDDIKKFYKEAANGDTKFMYRSYMLRAVKAGYKQTQEDINDELNGKVSFIYVGSKNKDVQVPERSVKVQSIIWQDNGVYYTLNDNGNSITLENLYKIANAIMTDK